MKMLLAVLFAVVACAEPTTSTVLAVREHLAPAKGVVVDSIAVMSSLRDKVINAPENCQQGQFTGCPTFRYGDFIEGFVDGVFVGYVDRVICTSSNPAVASVDSKCYATVRGQGTTTITVSFDRGRLMTSTTLTAN